MNRTGAGVDVGYTTGMRTELRVGYDAADVRARLRIGVPSLPEAKGSDSVASLRWTFDGQNSPLVPSRGARVSAAFRYYFDTPEIVDTNDVVLQQARDVPQAEVAGSWFKRVGQRKRLVLSGSAGSSFGHDPGFNQFYLGGPLRLGSYNPGALRGDNYVLGVAGLLHEWARLPGCLGRQRVPRWMGGTGLRLQPPERRGIQGRAVGGHRARDGRRSAVPGLQPVADERARAVLSRARPTHAVARSAQSSRLEHDGRVGAILNSR